MNLLHERLRELRVCDVMNRQVVRIPVRATMTEAAAVLAEHAHSAAPVVNAQGQCVGILSATDFLRRDRGGSVHAALGPSSLDIVENHMTAAVQTIACEKPLLEAARMMCLAHVHRLVVLDGQGRVTGVVSTMDIVAALLNAADESDVEFLQESR